MNEFEMKLIKYAIAERGLSEDEAIYYLESIKEIVMEAWELIKEKVSIIVESLNRQKSHKRHWHVPIKISPPPMPDVKLPKLHCARSNL